MESQLREAETFNGFKFRSATTSDNVQFHYRASYLVLRYLLYQYFNQERCAELIYQIAGYDPVV